MVSLRVSVVFLAIKVSFRVTHKEINGSYIVVCVRMVSLKANLHGTTLSYAICLGQV